MRKRRDAIPSPGAEDLRLVRRILDGDRSAFEATFDDLTPRLYRFASSRLGGDREAAREIVQASVCKAIENLSKFRGEATLFTWMCGICRFEILAWLRQRRRGARELELFEESADVRASLECASATLELPDTELQRSEIVRWVHATLDHLPPHYSKTLEWKYCQELTVHEIAERLGVGLKAAESTLTRARAAFRSAFPRLEAAASGKEREGR